MIAQKILNNNIVSSVDEKGHEIIVVGRGIGWGVKQGEIIAEEKIEKIFRMDTATSTAKLKKLLVEVPIDAVEVSMEIIDYAKKKLEKKFNKNVYITLTDHISFAIERMESGFVVRNALDHEVRKFYSKEYAVGVHALRMIEERLGYRLPEDEAASIALHIVNAEYDGDMEKTIEMTSLIKIALNIVRYRFSINFDEESLDYQRFVTHLLFFAQRVMEKKVLQTDEDDFLYNMLSQKYEDAFFAACQMGEVVEKKYHFHVNKEEISYLTIHIARVIHNK